MMQTIFMFAAAFNLVLVACFTTASGVYLILLAQVAPVTIAVGLSVFAFARLKGWPI